MCLPPEIAFKEKKPRRKFFKPRIRKLDHDTSRWECFGVGQVGVGDTPAQAYEAWRYAAFTPVERRWTLEA